MIRRIAFIHTVAMLVDRFRPRFQAALPDADRGEVEYEITRGMWQARSRD